MPKPVSTTGQKRGDHSDHEHDHDHDHEANPFVIFMVFNVFVAAALYGVYYLVQNPRFIISCDSSQPLVNVTDNFMAEKSFSRLTTCLKNHHSYLVMNSAIQISRELEDL